jgi:hypothetical protein
VAHHRVEILREVPQVIGPRELKHFLGYCRRGPNQPLDRMPRNRVIRLGVSLLPASHRSAFLLGIAAMFSFDRSFHAPTADILARCGGNTRAPHFTHSTCQWSRWVLVIFPALPQNGHGFISVSDFIFVCR